MPELPEVETTCNAIKSKIINKKIKQVIIRQPKLRWEIPKDIAKKITEKNIKSILRRGKYIVIEFIDGYLLIHLGMSGKLCITTTDEKPGKHAHVDFVINNNLVLRYDDPRRFGCILWAEDYEEHKLIKHLGPEPLTKDFNTKYLIKKINNKKTNIKQLIMNSKIVVGVGNIYANEALFNSNILPKREGKSISEEEAKLLVQEIKKVLKLAIKQGGTTLKDFFSGENNPGYFAQKLKVYGRSGENCLTCKKILKEERIGNRTTVFCDSCQI